MLVPIRTKEIKVKSKKEALYWKATENKVYTGSIDPRRKSQDVTGYHSFESRAPLSRRETSQGESRHIYATLQANERRASRSERSDHYEKKRDVCNNVRRREASDDEGFSRDSTLNPCWWS